ncbi:MAG TPA: hypothetical protein VLG47_07595 [Candidatus Saccharimonadales bacterium]|nr:hypothetical protein [Candidatus Saccharimonadales bacterium]
MPTSEVPAHEANLPAQVDELLAEHQPVRLQEQSQESNEPHNGDMSVGSSPQDMDALEREVAIADTLPQPPDERIRSGMHIWNAEPRQNLVRIFGPRTTDEQLSDLDWLHANGATGIREIVEVRDPRLDRWYKCIQYAFGTVKGEDWTTIPKDPDTQDVFDIHFSFETREHLAKYDYVVVDHPEAGDVIAYGRRRGSYSERIEHFGIYNGPDEGVTSKFARGNVYRHDIDAIPFTEHEVTFAIFFRKVQTPGQ